MHADVYVRLTKCCGVRPRFTLITEAGRLKLMPLLTAKLGRAFLSFLSLFALFFEGSPLIDPLSRYHDISTTPGKPAKFCAFLRRHCLGVRHSSPHAPCQSLFGPFSWLLELRRSVRKSPAAHASTPGRQRSVNETNSTTVRIMSVPPRP